MTRILVVDDEPDLEALIRQRFRKQIKESDYDFLFAGNGREALASLEKNTDVDLVLTDINMPEMDGLTLLSELNNKNYFLETVIVSAYGDMDNIRTAMNLGAFDFITKPIDFKDLEVTMSKTIKHVLQLKENAETLRENDTLKIYLNEINAQKKLKDRFFAIISHDLRGPVNSFQGLTAILENYIQKKKYEQLEGMITEVGQATNQLSRLLDNLLNWASSELSIIPYEPVKIDAAQMIDDLIQIFHSSAKVKDIAMTSHIKPETYIWADMNTTLTIFRNLINNALKFTEENGAIEISAQPDAEFLAISIKDSGIGVSQDKLTEIFKLSGQSSTFGTQGEKGVGLGLPLVSEFVKLNKGKVRAESADGSGTTFIVSLPASSESVSQ
ncbi:MAG: signal transduction histidine kinase [Flavobacteriaceae bacterium]|jgi:signal transduction histidine kinase